MSDQPQPAPDPQTPTPPSAEEQRKAQTVGVAMGQARISAEGEGKTSDEQRQAAVDAGRATAEHEGLPVTDDQLEQMATMMSGKVFDNLAAMFEQRGAFDPPPEPAGPPPSAPPPPGGEPPNPTQMEAPRRKTFAERFLNG